MKSYIEPLSAAEALDVLDLYGVDTPGAFPSIEHEGCVEVEMAGHTVLLETPDSVKMLFGDDAATALRHHASFRKDAAEIMGSALDLGDFLYNVYSGEAFIPDTAPDGEFFGFHVAHIPLTAIIEEDADPLSPDVCDYGLDFIGETNEGVAAGDFDPSGELAEENARLYGAPSVADLAETVWGCTSLEPVKVRHFGVNGFRGLEFSFGDGAETRMRAWQFDACPKVAAALAAALTYRCEKGFYMEAGCAGENGGVWGLSFDRKERGAYAVARFHPERAAYDPRRREYASRCPILLEQDGSGNIAFRHPGTVPDRLIDNFIPAMKRCDVSDGGPTPGTEDAPEGATVRATRPGDINISFPALAERAQAAALATACGATTAAGNRL